MTSIPRETVKLWATVNIGHPNEPRAEQALWVRRLLIEMGNDYVLSQHFAFAGGTVLQQIRMPEATRYTDDIDLWPLHSDTDVEKYFEQPLRRILNRLGLLAVRKNRASGSHLVIVHLPIDDEDADYLTIEMFPHEQIAPFIADVSVEEFAMETDWFSGSTQLRCATAPALAAFIMNRIASYPEDYDKSAA